MTSTAGAEEAYRLTASEALSKMKSGEITVESYCQSLLQRTKERDDAVQAWAYLDPELVLAQARALDKVPAAERGPLHGVCIGVKDVIYTKDMPTQHNSPIYKDDAPKLDSASIIILRQAGAVIFGKTTTTEFAATVRGPATRNPHDPSRTPGGSSSGSGAAVGDMQVPIALGTQTGGSTIRPGSFNGIYALKPTWNSISREGQKVYSLILDTLGLYARSAADLDLLADIFALRDDERTAFAGVRGASFGVLRGPAWANAGEGTQAALAKAADLLRTHGAVVEDVELPSEFDDIIEQHRIVLQTDGNTAFLPEYRLAREQLGESLQGHVENVNKFTHKQQLAAFDSIGALRPKMDEILGRYAAIVTPSVPDEAPVGLEKTGSAIFCNMWTALHTPTVNIPGFHGSSGMPVGVTLVGARYHDRHLLTVCKAVGEIFETEGGWKSSL